MLEHNGIVSFQLAKFGYDLKAMMVIQIVCHATLWGVDMNNEFIPCEGLIGKDGIECLLPYIIDLFDNISKEKEQAVLTLSRELNAIVQDIKDEQQDQKIEFLIDAVNTLSEQQQTSESFDLLDIGLSILVIIPGGIFIAVASKLLKNSYKPMLIAVRSSRLAKSVKFNTLIKKADQSFQTLALKSSIPEFYDYTVDKLGGISTALKAEAIKLPEELAKLAKNEIESTLRASLNAKVKQDGVDKIKQGINESEESRVLKLKNASIKFSGITRSEIRRKLGVEKTALRLIAERRYTPEHCDDVLDYLQDLYHSIKYEPSLLSKDYYNMAIAIAFFSKLGFTRKDFFINDDFTKNADSYNDATSRRVSAYEQASKDALLKASKLSRDATSTLYSPSYTWNKDKPQLILAPTVNNLLLKLFHQKVKLAHGSEDIEVSKAILFQILK
jgi:hypothetical protein